MKNSVVNAVLVILIAGCSVAKKTESPLSIWNSKDVLVETRVTAAREIAPAGLTKSEVFRRLGISHWSGYWSRFNDQTRNGDALYYFMVGFPDGDVAFLFEQDGSALWSKDARLLEISVSKRLRPLPIK